MWELKPLDFLDWVGLFLQLLTVIAMGYGLYFMMTVKQRMKRRVRKLIRTMGPRELAAFKALLVLPVRPENSNQHKRLFDTFGEKYVTRAEQRFMGLLVGEDIPLEDLRVIARRLLKIPAST